MGQIPGFAIPGLGSRFDPVPVPIPGRETRPAPIPGTNTEPSIYV